MMKQLVVAAALLAASVVQAKAMTFRQAIKDGYDVKGIVNDAEMIAGKNRRPYILLQKGKSVVVCGLNHKDIDATHWSDLSSMCTTIE